MAKRRKTIPIAHADDVAPVTHVDNQSLDTLVHYRQVLDSVTYNSTSSNPTNFGADETARLPEEDQAIQQFRSEILAAEEFEDKKPRGRARVDVPIIASTLANRTGARLPTGKLDENRAIDIIGEWLSKEPPEIWSDKEYGRESLQNMLEEELREGGYEFADKADKEAKAGNFIAHAALLTINREMLANTLPEEKPGYPLIRAYGQRALRQPYKRPRGRSQHDNLARNLRICLCVILACHEFREFDVRPTRGRYAAPAHRTNRAPSGISLVVAALERRGLLLLDERSVQKYIWYGLPGALARKHAPKAFWPR
jgi:hypothetical protein